MEVTCNMSSEYPDYWPVVMRSSRHSKHLERKREQERIERQYKDNPPKDVDGSKYYKWKNTVKNGSSSKKGNDIIKQESMEDIKNRYSEKIIVWIRANKTVKNEFFCFYVLEYKGHIRLERGERKDTLVDSILSSVSCAINNIKKPGYSLVFMCPYDFCEYKNGFAEYPHIADKKK